MELMDDEVEEPVRRRKIDKPRDKAQESEEINEMEVLRKIIMEVNKTRKVDAIIRAFSRHDPDDLEYLTKLLTMADLPKSDIYFIIENWAHHRNVEMPDIDKILSGRERKPVTRGRSVSDSDDEDISAGDDEIKELEEASKRELQMMKREMARLQLLKRIKQMQKELEELEGTNKTKEEEPKIVKRVVRRLRLDDKGNPIRGPDGNPIYDEIVEEVPVSGNVPSQYIQTQTDPLYLMTALANIMKSLQPETKKDDEEIRRLEREKAELEKKLVEQQKEFEKRLVELENKQKEELNEIKRLLEMKALEEKYGQYIGALSKKIEDLEKSSQLTDEKFNIKTQKEIIENVAGELKQAATSFKEDLKSLGEMLVKDLISERRHKRLIEKVLTAKQLGISVDELQRTYEQMVVPEVTEEEMMRELEQSIEEEISNDEDINDFSDIDNIELQD